MLRGYLNNSRQDVFSASANAAGAWISRGSTCSAHASALRASSCGPARSKKRDYSGTQYLIISTNSAGVRPTRNRPRQPIVSAR